MLATTHIWSATSSREWVAYRPSAAPRSCDNRRANVLTSATARRGFGDLRDPWRDEERRQALLKYVQEVQPQSVVQFAEQTHPMVVQAMRQTVLNVVGSLPPQYFEVRISAVAESLAQLMLSIMTTGYMLRSAQFRMELQQSLKQLPTVATTTTTPTAATASTVTTTTVAMESTAAAVTAGGPTVAAFSSAEYGSSGSTDGDGSAAAAALTGAPDAVFLYDGEQSPYAPGVQKKKVEGEVLRWHLARGEVERMVAADYIELLEREVAALRAQIGNTAAATSAPPAPPSQPSSSSSVPLATAGFVEVLGPETTLTSSSSSSSSLACVSPLPGFGERAGPGLPHNSLTAAASSTSTPVVSSAAAPATMGCGGIPLVVGSPLGLPRNELLDYLHGLQASGQGGGFKELACSPSAASGEAVKEAMELFVARLMGTIDPEALTKMNAEFTSVELSKVLFWLMAVGYTLKTIEARLELEDGTGDSSGGSYSGRPSPGGGKPGNKGGSGNGNGSGKDGKKGGFGGLRGLLPGF